MAEIVLNRVSKRFPDGTVTLNEVGFTIHDGEFFILVGPSGCGKSTLLNLIVGLEEVSGGEIRVDGKVVNDLDPRARNMAMVFQSYAIYPHMSVRENIAFPLRLAKLPPAEIARRVDRAAEILELTPLLDRKPASLSGGQRQRVAMGRAMVREPVAFLLDEPLSNLDARLRVQMRAEIARLHRRLKATMIYVTHDQTEAMTLGDRVAVLNRGELQQIGTPRELYREPANRFVAGFIGSPAMNLLPARIDGPRLQLPMGEVTLPSERRLDLPAHSNGILAGIRPEHLSCPRGPIASQPGCLTFAAVVDRVEWLGADLFAYFDVPRPADFEAAGDPSPPGNSGCLSLIARLDPAMSLHTGESVNLQLDVRRLHLFDGETGRNFATN